MSPFTCMREPEVTELLHKGHWPEACPEELRAHVQSCRSCSDLVLVTAALQASRRHTLEMPRLESPGALWWRAQLRRRNAAIETVGRPILGAQIFALTLMIAVGAGGLVWKGNLVKDWLKSLPGALHLETLLPTALWPSGGVGWIVPALAMVALLSGVVVYLATEKQ
jgi:hypothetical protein